METPSTETSVTSVITTITEYTTTEAALATLREKYSGIKYDVTSTKGMDEAKASRAEIKKYRIALEAKRVEVKEPALKQCQLIDSEAKRITAELTKLEKPIDDQIKVEEERKKKEEQEKVRIENERVAGIRTRIDKIKSLPLLVVNYNSAELQEFVSKIESQPIGIEFAEFTDEATAVKAETVGILNNVLTAKLNSEQELAKAKEENDQQAETLRVKREAFELEQAEFNRKRDEQAVELPKEVQITQPIPSAVEEAKPAIAATEMITIPKSEYDQLLADSKLLSALRAGGVDNWDGWDFAIEALEAA